MQLPVMTGSYVVISAESGDEIIGVFKAGCFGNLFHGFIGSANEFPCLEHSLLSQVRKGRISIIFFKARLQLGGAYAGLLGKEINGYMDAEIHIYKFLRFGDTFNIIFAE